MIVAECPFETRQQLAEALAHDVAEALRQTLGVKNAACLAVSGGQTPVLFFQALSQQDLDWAMITVTLVDERQVPESSPRSNAALVRQHLLQNRAAQARFVPLHDNVMVASGLSLDVVVLGMGTDGHTASFFPGGDMLHEALDPTTVETILPMQAPGAGEARLTYTFAALNEARLLCLHIEGAEKRDVLNKALGEGAVEDMPVRCFLRSEDPVTLYWCP